MVRLVDLNFVATLACHFAPAEAGMSPMLGAIGEDEEDDDEDSYHVHSDDGEYSYNDNCGNNDECIQGWLRW